MKKIYFFICTIFLLGATATHAQNTDGYDFWVTFGANYIQDAIQPTSALNLQIRIASNENGASGTINFVNLNTSIPFSIGPYDVFTHNLSSTEKAAVYNSFQTGFGHNPIPANGISYRTIYVHSDDNPITVYAMNQATNSTDATNILPVTALGDEYYQISYKPRTSSSSGSGSYDALDAFAVIAIKDGTEVFFDHGATPVAILDSGQVYYQTSPDASASMTGKHIKTSEPVAFFCLTQGAVISSTGDHLMQQLSPINTWGKKFFVPISKPLASTNCGVDRVRIVASKNGTNITKYGGGSLLNFDGAKNSLLGLNAGEFIEFEVNSTNDAGCYIESNNRIGVCAFLKSGPSSGDNRRGDPAIAWLPAIQQTAPIALVAPFIPNVTTSNLHPNPTTGPPTNPTPPGIHYAIIITPTAHKTETDLYINGLLTPLTGDTWKDNSDAKMSYYVYELPDLSANVSYRFENPAKLLVMGYGIGQAESYYYLGFAAQRDLSVTFSIPTLSGWGNGDLCCEHNIIITGTVEEIEAVDKPNISWKINGVSRPDLKGETWPHSVYFPIGKHEISMEYVLDSKPREFKDSINVGGAVVYDAIPPSHLSVNAAACYVTQDIMPIADCYEKNTVITLTPNYPHNATDGYCKFLKWIDENGNTIPCNLDNTLTVTVNQDSVKRFAVIGMDDYLVTTRANPRRCGYFDHGGIVVNDSTYIYDDLATLTAHPYPGYRFVNWTENGFDITDSDPTDPVYPFNVTADRALVANFARVQHNLHVEWDPIIGGTVDLEYADGTMTGNTIFYDVLIDEIAYAILTALPALPDYEFDYWEIDNNPEPPQNLSFPNSYIFEKITAPHDVVAHFKLKEWNISVSSSNPAQGFTYPSGGPFTYDHGDVIPQIAAIPYQDFEFDYWEDFGYLTNKPASFTLTVENNHDFVAFFKPKLYNIYVQANPGGKVDGGGTDLAAGALVTIIAEAFAGYSFDGWSSDDNDYPPGFNHNNLTETFNILPKTQTYTANFKPLEGLTVKLFADPAHGKAECDIPNSNCKYDYGATATVIATPFPPYLFDYWERNGIRVSDPAAGAVYSFSIYGNDTLTAIFKLPEYTHTVLANNNSWGTVSGGGTFPHGTTDTLRAYPQTPDYGFHYWELSDGITHIINNPYYPTFTQNETYTAIFYPLTSNYKVTLIVDPPQAQTDGCSVVGGGFYNLGDWVPIEAHAADYYTFKGWSLLPNGFILSTKHFDTISVNANITLYANFIIDSYEISVSTDPVDVNEFGIVGNGTVPRNTNWNIEITQPSTPHYTFQYWESNGIPRYSIPNPHTIRPVTQDSIWVAHFTPDQYTVIVSSAGNGNVFQDGTGTYPYHTSVTVWAVPDQGYSFVEWQEKGKTVPGAGQTYTFDIEEDRDLVAYFEPTWTVTVISVPSGVGTFSGAGEFPVTHTGGTTITLTSISDCYTFDYWVVDRDTTWSVTSVTINPLTSDTTVYAHFIQDSTAVLIATVDPDGAGTIFMNGVPVLDTLSNLPCESVWLTATPTLNSGYKFDKWTTLGGVFISNNPTDEFLVTSDTLKVVAHFVLELCNLTLQKTNNGGTPCCSGPKPKGTSVTIEARPYSAFDFVEWTDLDGNVISNDENYTFIIDRDTTLIATYADKSIEVVLHTNNSSWGTVAFNPPTTPPDTWSGLSYNDEITIEGIPDASGNYVFDRWTEGQNGPLFTHLPYVAINTFNVERSLDLWAHFKGKPCTINIRCQPANGGLISGGGNYEFDDWCQLTATPNNHYTWFHWEEDDGSGTVASTNANCSFQVKNSRNLVAIFIPNKYPVELSTNPNPAPGCSVEGAGNYDYYSEATIIAVPGEHYTFDRWTRTDGSFVSREDTFTFRVIDTARLIAHFISEPLNISISVIPPQAATYSVTGNFDYGLPITIELTPNTTEYSFQEWKKDGIHVSSDYPSYTFIVEESCALTAHFASNPYTVTLLTDPPGISPVSGGGTMGYGEDTTISVEPVTCYDFDGWWEADTLFSTSFDTTITVLADRTFIAHFTQKLLNITISADPPSGGGTVSPTAGFTNLPCGEEITAIAYPEIGYVLERWTFNGEVVSQNETCTFTPTASGELIAHFKYVTYSVTVSADPKCGSAFANGTYPVGDRAPIWAIANPEYTFVNWITLPDSVEYSKKINDTLLMNQDYILYANFRRSTLDVCVTADPKTGGDAEVEGGNDGCRLNYTPGETAKIKATAKEGYTFVEWLKDDGKNFSYEAEYEFPVTRTFHLVAKFELTKYEIKLQADPKEGGELIGAGTFPFGSVDTIEAIPYDNFTFKNWTEGNKQVSVENPFAFTVEKSRTLVANFVEKICTVTVAASPLHGGDVSGGGIFNNGSTTIIMAIEKPNYKFINWTLNDKEFSIKSTDTIKVTKSMHLVANFMELYCDITVTANPKEGGSALGGGKAIPNGDTITVIAIANENYIFLSWTEWGAQVSDSAEYQFKVTQSRTLIANFVPKFYNITVLASPAAYGSVSGGGEVKYGEETTVHAVPEPGYDFDGWYEDDGTFITDILDYTFKVTCDRTLIAYFEVPKLNFDEYAATLWDNTFMLNIKKLEDKEYKVTGCKWFKEGIELVITNTINEFSYSAGPNAKDRLDLNTDYTFQLTTIYGDTLYSTKKRLTEHTFHATPPKSPLVVYPNPAWAGSMFTIEGVTPETPIEVYNQYGVCLSRKIAAATTETLSLDLPSGLYFIRNNNKEGKITIIR